MSCELGFVDNLDHLCVCIEFPEDNDLTRSQVYDFIVTFRNRMNSEIKQYSDIDQAFNLKESIALINEHRGFVFILYASTDVFMRYYRELKAISNDIYSSLQTV